MIALNKKILPRFTQLLKYNDLKLKFLLINYLVKYFVIF